MSQAAKANAARELAVTLTNETAAELMKPSVESALELLYENKNDEVYMDDYYGLLGVMENIEEGLLDVAFASASSFETQLRDEIPMAVWVFIGGELLH